MLRDRITPSTTEGLPAERLPGSSDSIATLESPSSEPLHQTIDLNNYPSAETLTGLPDTSRVETVHQNEFVELDPDSSGAISQVFDVCSGIIIQQGEHVVVGHVRPWVTNVTQSIMDLVAEGDWRLDGTEQVILMMGDRSYPTNELYDIVKYADAHRRGYLINVPSGDGLWSIGLNLETGELRIAAGDTIYTYASNITRNGSKQPEPFAHNPSGEGAPEAPGGLLLLQRHEDDKRISTMWHIFAQLAHDGKRDEAQGILRQAQAYSMKSKVPLQTGWAILATQLGIPFESTPT